MELKNLLTICGPLSVNWHSEIPNETMKQSESKVSMCVDVDSDLQMTRINLE